MESATRIETLEKELRKIREELEEMKERTEERRFFACEDPLSVWDDASDERFDFE